MKKILISSLCALFSFDGTSGMTNIPAVSHVTYERDAQGNVESIKADSLVSFGKGPSLPHYGTPYHQKGINELLNLKNNSVPAPSSLAFPDIGESPIVCDIDKEGIVKSIKVNVLATLGDERAFCCYKNAVNFICMVLGKNFARVFTREEAEVFFILSVELKGRGTLTAIADKISEREFGSNRGKKNYVQQMLCEKLPTSLAATGIEIFHCGRNGREYEIRVDGKPWTYSCEGNSTSPTTVEIPVRKVGGIGAPTMEVGVYQCKSMRDTPPEGTANLSEEAIYFLITKARTEVLDREIGMLAKDVVIKKQWGDVLLAMFVAP